MDLRLSGRAPLRRLTFDGNNSNPVWSADGRWIAYNSDCEGSQRIFRQAADGTGVADRLSTPGSGEEHFSTSWSATVAFCCLNSRSRVSSAWRPLPLTAAARSSRSWTYLDFAAQCRALAGWSVVRVHLGRT